MTIYQEEMQRKAQRYQCEAKQYDVRQGVGVLYCRIGAARCCIRLGTRIL